MFNFPLDLGYSDVVDRSIPQASCYISPEQRAEEIERNPWDLEFEAGEMFTKAENKARACADTSTFNLPLNLAQSLGTGL